MSEELENSLQQAIENHLNERFQAIEENLSRLQDEFNATFVRLRESKAGDSLQDTFLSSAIAAHLQAARAQKLSGSLTPTHAAQSAQVTNLNHAVREIEEQQSQVNILGALLRNAAGFAERVALFVIKQDQAIGWRVCEASDPNTVEAIPSISFSLSADTSVGIAARSGSASANPPGTHAEDNLISDQLGGDPNNSVVVPLVVRGKAVAVLYADSASAEADAINQDALESLTRVAAMAVELISLRAAQPAPAAEYQAAQPAPADEPPAVEAVAEAAPEPGYAPRVEPQTAEVVEPVEEIPVEVAPEPVAEEVQVEATAELAEAEAPMVTDSKAAIEEHVEAAPIAAMPIEEPSTPATQPEMHAPAPEPASQYAAPLGSARRYGVVEPELPVSVGEEERRLHNDARRFARLLVSEIKLYNEPKVKEGRNKGDLYERLRDDIDRSRQMYERRVAPPVAARHDYFHQELVNSLAEGDPAKLGVSYPGEAASAA